MGLYPTRPTKYTAALQTDPATDLTPLHVLRVLVRAARPMKIGLLAWKLDVDPNHVHAALRQAERLLLAERVGRSWQITDIGRRLVQR